MAGPITISVVTDASRAVRELTIVTRAVQTLGKIPAPRFDRTGFKRTFAQPYAQAMKLTFADADSARKFFERKSRTTPVGRAPTFNPDVNVSFLKSLRNYKALSGEVRVSLSQLNERVAGFEDIAQRSYNTATSKLDKYKDSAASAVVKLKAIALATAAISLASKGLRAATGYLKGAVGNASNLAESTSKATQIFKDGTPEVLAFAKSADRNLGLSQAAAIDAAASYGDLFQQLGFGRKEATKFSTSTLQLAADLGSFSNVDVADASDRIAAAYRGEFDGLQKLIPNINAARVQTEALAISGKKSAKDLTAQDKARAVNAIITKDASRATGDFARTQNGLANVVRTNQAGLANLSASIGKALLPGVTALAIAFRDKVLPVLGDLVDKYGPKVSAFFTRVATADLPKLTEKLGGLDFSKPFSTLKPGDLSKASDAFSRIGDSLGNLSSATGTGLVDTLSVFSIVIATVADHTDLLAKAMPVLVGGLVAFKLAQLAANVAATFNVPLKVAEILVNRQLVKSNQALIASRAEGAVAAVASTAAETAVTGAKERGVIATVASRVATLAGAAATGVLTVATGALNVVMSLNPIALVVIAIIALAAAFVIAYKKSDRFRAVVDKVFRFLKSAIMATISFVRTNWKTILLVLTGPIGLAVAAFRRYKGKIVSVFRSVRDSVKAIFKGIGTTILAAIKGAINSVIALVNKPLQAINAVAGKIPGVPSLPLIPALATGGIVNRATFALLGEAGPEAVIPLSKLKLGGGDTYVTVNMHIESNDPAAIGKALNRTLRFNGVGVAR